MRTMDRPIRHGARPPHPPFGGGQHPDRPAATPAEAPSESAAEQYRAISEVTADWAYALHIEPDGRAVADWTSSHIEGVTGFPSSELGPVDAWLRLVHPDDRGVMRGHLAALQTGRTDTVEYRIVTRSGETRWIRDYARPLKNDPDGAVHVVGGVRDITLRRQAELDRARLLSELELVNERCGRLARAATEDLRGPAEELLAVTRSLETCATDGDAHDAELREDVERLRRVGSHLAHLADELAKFTSIEAIETLED
jgi:PAS domain S-box-containing protein